MPRLPTGYPFGNKEEMTVEKLLEIIERMYIEIAEAVNKKADVYERTTDGQTSDVFLTNGSININTTTNKVEMLTDHVDTQNVTWTQIS